MRTNRFWLSVLAVWAVMFGTDRVFHGIWLASLYSDTAHFWKNEGESAQYLWLVWIGYTLFSWGFMWLFEKGLTSGNVWNQAFRFAIAFILVAKIPPLLIQFTYTAYPGELIFKWGVIYVIQIFACSYCIAWIYRPVWRMKFGS